MLDLGTSLLASVARDPDALAIVDGPLRLTYRAWYEKISAAVAVLDDLGLRPGDHLVTVLQNRFEAATLHWACQLAGLILTPLNWRAKSDEIDFCLDDAQARALIYQDVAAEAVAAATRAKDIPRLSVGMARGRDRDLGALLAAGAPEATPRAGADAFSLMLYTSGTTSRPKGVP